MSEWLLNLLQKKQVLPISQQLLDWWKIQEPLAQAYKAFSVEGISQYGYSISYFENARMIRMKQFTKGISAF
jgi:hypothetical protein